MIDTLNKKLALIEYGDVYQPGIPVSGDGIDQADNQQLLWEYPGILWEQLAQTTPWLVSLSQVGTPTPIVVRNDPEVSIVKSTVITTPKIIGDELPDRGRN